MNSQSNRRYNNKLANLPVATPVSRRRRRQRNTVPRGLPSHFPNAPGDQSSFNFKFTEAVAIPASSSAATALIVMGVGSDASGIGYLSNRSVLFSANAQCYTRYMITDLTIELRATGVGGNANTFVAASYVPSTTSLDAVPSGLSEVSQAIHYTESSLGTVGRVRIRPCDYYNDWRIINNADDNDKQCGVIQVYGSAAASSSGVTAGVMTISGTVHMCGLRV